MPPKKQGKIGRQGAREASKEHTAASEAAVSETAVEAATTPAPQTGTTIPLDLVTPSIHMEAEQEDVFDKLGSEMPEMEGGGSETVGESEELEVAGAGSEPIDLVEQAANDLFDSLGVEHVGSEETGEDTGNSDIRGSSRLSNPIAPTEKAPEVETAHAQEVVEGADQDRTVNLENAAPEPDLTAGATTDPLDHQEVENVTEDVFDKLNSSNDHEQPIESSSHQVGLDETEDQDDVFANLASISDKDQAQVAEDLEEAPTGAVLQNEEPTNESMSHGGGLQLDDGDDADDDFANLVSDQGDNVEHSDRKEANHSTLSEQAAAPALELVETEDDSLFDNIGSTSQEVGEAIQDIDENGDDAAERERKYQLLLEEFGAEEEDFLPAPQASSTYQAADLFGEESGSTPFDELVPAESEFLQTASSSTTPPSLSIENSLQDIEPYEGDNSNWLGSALTDADQSLLRSGQQIGAAATAEASSPIDFEVPYGWYEGDTFHYYTSEQREQVRLAMMESSEAPADQSGTQTHDYSSSLTASTSQSGFSENAARRTPHPETYNDPYAPISSGLPTGSTSRFSESQYTASTTSDPYAPVSTYASPAQPHDPYAPATPAPVPFDPYADVHPAKPRIYYGGPTGFTGRKSKPAAVSQRPTPPQRVASTAYDPPFLRPQKSFVRPASAASVASTSYGVPPVPPLPTVSTPPPPIAPPAGPPRRTTTPYAPPPPIQERPPRATTPLQSSAYTPVPIQAAAESEPPAPIAPPAGPPRGPPSRPPSSMAARQAQRAPSYNSFDPPLRTQTVSRASMKAPQAMPPPQQTPPPPSLVLSPPTESTSLFTTSRPPSRAAPGFEAPPPPGPPRRDTSSFQAPPRPPSVQNFAREPVRAASPMRPQQPEPDYEHQPATFGRHEDRQTPPPASFDIPQLHSGQEEPEEGGAWDNGEEEEYTTRRLSTNDRQQEDYGNTQEVREEPESYHRPPSKQMENSYAPAPSHRDYSHGQETSTYDPYGPDQVSQPSEKVPPSASYDPYGPGQQANIGAPSFQASAPAPTSYDPYGPGHEDTTTGSKFQSSAPVSPPYDPYSTGQQQPASARDSQSSSFTPYDPYGPGQPQSISQSSQKATGPDSTPYNPYAPSSTSPRAPYAEPPSTLGLSSLGSSIAPQQDAYDSPYAPARSAAEQYTPGPDTHLRVASPGHGTDYGTSPPAHNYFSALPSGPADQTYTPQQVLDQRPVSEDPLGRSTLAARNAPIAVFGFGGVLITAFPGMANAHNESAGGHGRTASYGYASGRGQLWIRSVSELVSESALKSNETVFPGPLILDSSSAKGAAGDKKKKEAVLDYLRARVEETEKGLPYLKTSANATRREQEGKLVLLRLLMAMIIGEGKLAGSQQVEDAIRTALQNPSDPSATSTTFSPTSVTGPAANGFNTSLYGSNHNAPSAAATPAQLAQLSTMLSNGDKRDAALFAANNGLWSHALLISSSVDQEFWREIVTRFSGAELNGGVAGSAGLKASYTLFAGSSPAAIDDLFAAAHISEDPSSDQWREVVGALLFNGKSTDLSYLDDLGARFTSAGLANAGHVCSLLSPTSAFGDVSPAALERPISMVQDSRDEDAVVFAEIAEYARSLITVPKGQELPVHGLPQLLPYKLHRAWWAAELGEHDLARRYCTAVESGSKHGKTGASFLTRPFLNSLEDLQERLTGEPSTKPAKLIGGRKSGKPGVNKIGSWIEGRLTKFIAGEDDREGPIKATPPTKGKESSGAPVGPFSHFSTISPGPSNPVTRATSSADINSHYGGRASPHQGQQDVSSSSSMYGDQFGGGGGYGGYNPYSGPGAEDEAGGGDEATPHALEPAGDNGDVELLNPMAALSLGPTRQQSDYAPPVQTRHVEEEEEEDDLGFGNSSLSRGRTPKPAEGGAGDDKAASKKKESAPAKAATPEPAAAKNEQKSGWLRGWFGKKEGEGSGPIVAKLGEESSMIFDPELKRWVVKGAKPEPAPAAPPPPPPSRPQSAVPASRASSATPPPSSLSRNTGSQASSNSGMPPSRTSGMGFTEMPDGGIKRQKSSLTDSVTPSSMTPPPGQAGGPPRPPSGPPKPPGPPGSSLDDLLSRPPSKRPASAARKGVKNRYVDVFQEGNK